MISTKIIYQVDAFANQPFRGNPAGVCILDQEPEVAWMQNVAMEMNLSETTFVIPQKDSFKIRYFTPVAEMKLCGHATLSASHILYETGMVKPGEDIIFDSKAGELRISKNGEWIKMNFPAYPLEKLEPTPEFERVTGAVAVELYKAGFGWTLALLENEAEVRKIKPDFTLMKSSIFGDLIVTSRSEDRAFDFVVRCFAPAVGIDEDPVTGSAHCALAPFWFEKTGKKQFNSHQISSREGILKVSLADNRVEISGQAITIFKASLFV